MVNALFLDNWTVTDYEQNDETLTITARYDLDPPSCPRCGVVGAKFYRHGPAEVEYVEAPAYGLRTTIKVDVPDLCGRPRVRKGLRDPRRRAACQGAIRSTLSQDQILHPQSLTLGAKPR